MIKGTNANTIVNSNALAIYTHAILVLILSDIVVAKIRVPGPGFLTKVIHIPAIGSEKVQYLCSISVDLDYDIFIDILFKHL